MRIRNSIYRRLVCAFLVQSLVFIPQVLVPAIEVDEISIPESYGVITEKHQGQKDKPVVIHIRDAHCNTQAQQNIAAIINSLVNNNDVSLVGLEGAQGEIDVENFTSFPVAEVRRDVSGAFMATGNISGSEYALINSDKPFKLHGIESSGLYAKNYNLFLNSFRKSDQYKSAFLTLKEYLGSFADKICGDKILGGFISANYSYLTKKESLTSYCKYVVSVAGDEKIDLTGFENISLLNKISALEESFNLKDVEVQAGESFDMLCDFVEGEDKEQLLQMKIKYQLGHLSNREYYDYLKKMMAEIEADLAEYPDLASYIEYLNCAGKLDFKSLALECDKLSASIIDKLAVTQTEKTIVSLMRNLAMLELTAELRLTHSDFEYIKEHKAEFTDQYFSKKIKELSEATKNPLSKPLNLTIFDTAIPEFISFYEISKLRDVNLADNLIAEIGKDNADRAAVVTGGFHTEGMTDYLAKKGYSYIVVSPNITSAGKDNYMERMSRGKSPFVQSLLSSNALAVESLLQKTGMVLSAQELRAYRNAFNAYLLAYSANNIKDAEFFRQNLKIFEDSLTSDVITKLKPVMDLIEQELGSVAREWAEKHFADLSEFKVEKVTSDELIIAMNIMDKRYTIDVSRKDIQDLNLEDTALKLASNLNMAVASISEIVPVSAKLQNIDAALVASAKNIASVVKSPQADNHRKLKSPEFISMLSGNIEFQKKMYQVLSDLKISEIWIEEGTPFEVFASIFDSINRSSSDPSRLTLSKKMAILDDFSYGIMVTTDLSGANQLNLYSVPELLAKKFGRKAELADLSASDREFNKSLATYFAGLPDGKNGIITSVAGSDTLMVPQIVDELSARVKTEFSDKIRDEIRAIFINRNATSMNNLEKYTHIFQTSLNVRAELTLLFVESVSSLLIASGSLSKNDETSFNQVLMYILINYGYDRALTIFDFLHGQSAQTTHRILNDQRVPIGKDFIPAAFMGHEVAIGNDVIEDLVSYDLSPDQFLIRMGDILYNPWNSQEDRNILIQNAKIFINKADKPQYLKALFDLLQFQNNKEIVFPEPKKEGDEKKDGVPDKSGLFSNSKPEDLYTILIGNAPLDEKESAIVYLSNSRNKESLELLMKYMDQSVPSKLIRTTVDRLVTKILLGITNGTLTTSEGLIAIDKLMQTYSRSHYLDMKKAILENLADMALAPNIPISVKAVVLMFLESAQNGPDITMRETARKLFREKEGYSRMGLVAKDIFDGKARDEIQLIMNNMGNINLLARKGLNNVDRLDLDTALEIYNSTKQTRILFELESTPTIDQFRKISELAIEIILLRDRYTGKWYILNGDEYSIDSEILLNQLLTGSFDVNIHNHPTERIPTPSGADLKTARLAEHNFIIAGDGLMTYGTPTKSPSGGTGVVDLDVFEKTYNSWADDKTIDQKTLFWLARKDYGVELKFQKWNEINLNETIPPSVSLPDLLYDQSPFVQSIGINALMGYNYQDLAGAVNLISAVYDKSKDSSYYLVSDSSRKTVNYFFDEMEHMLDNLILRLGIIQESLLAAKPYVDETIGRKLAMPERAQFILDNIDKYKNAIDTFDLQSFDNLQIIAQALIGLKDLTSDMEKYLFNIEIALNDILEDIPRQDMVEYGEISAFQRNIQSALNEISTLNEFLSESDAGTQLQNQQMRPSEFGPAVKRESAKETAVSFASTRKNTALTAENIIRELSSPVPTELSDAIINEMSTKMFLANKEITIDIFEKYNSIIANHPDLKKKMADLFAQALANSLADKNLIMGNDIKPFTLITGGFLNNFGLEYLNPLYTYFHGKPPGFFKDVIYGEYIEVNNIRIPLLFIAHSATLSNGVAVELASSQLPKSEFIEKMSKLLYNDLVTPRMRSFIFSNVSDYLKTNNKTDLLTALYTLTADHNSQEFELPDARKKPSYLSMAKLAFFRINMIVSRSTKPEKLRDLLLSDKPVGQKEYALMLLGESNLPDSLDILQNYVFNNLQPELSTLALGILMEKTQKWVSEGKISINVASEIVTQVIKMLGQLRYLEPKQAILTGLGNLAKDKKIDWQLRAVALTQLESAQLGPDITVLITAKEIFENINGYRLVKELSNLIIQGKLDDKLPYLMDKIKTPVDLAEMGLSGVDKISIETAIDIYRQNTKPGIIFELKTIPTIEDLKMLADLPFEVLVLRERDSHKFYIVSGDETSVNTQVLRYLSAVGKVDLAIHNHPEQDITRPSDTDIVYGAKNTENNYIIGKKGMAKFNQVTHMPPFMTPVRINDMSDFLSLVETWLSMKGEPNPTDIMTHLLMFRDFGVDYKFEYWEDIDFNKILSSSNPVNSLIINQKPSLQCIGIASIANSSYPNLINAIGALKIIEGSSINSNIKFVNELSQAARSNFYEQMNNLRDVFEYKFGLINKWLYSNQGYFLDTIALELGKQDQATEVIAAIHDFDIILNKFKVPDIDNIYNANVFLDQLKSTVPKLLVTLNTISANLEELLIDLSSSNPKEYIKLLEFNRRLENAIDISAFMMNILAPSVNNASSMPLSESSFNDPAKKKEVISADYVPPMDLVPDYIPLPVYSAQKDFKNHYNAVADFILNANKMLESSNSFERRLNELVFLFYETGVYRAFQDNTVNPFELLMFLNLSSSEKILIQMLSTINGDGQLNRFFESLNFTAEQKETVHFFLNVITHGVISAIPSRPIIEMRWQTLIRPELVLDGNPLSGELTKDGAKGIAAITRKIDMDSKDVEITVNGKKIFLRTESRIISELGFTGETAVADFAKFVKEGIDGRGEYLFSGLVEGETLYIGVVDASATLFADHIDDGFIGINRGFFAMLDKKFQKPAFLVGLTHELRHEAGVYRNTVLVEDTPSVEKILTDEDVEFTKTLIPDLKGFAQSLSLIVGENADIDVPDYLRQIKREIITAEAPPAKQPVTLEKPLTQSEIIAEFAKPMSTPLFWDILNEINAMFKIDGNIDIGILDKYTQSAAANPLVSKKIANLIAISMTARLEVPVSERGRLNQLISSTLDLGGVDLTEQIYTALKSQPIDYLSSIANKNHYNGKTARVYGTEIPVVLLNTVDLFRKRIVEKLFMDENLKPRDLYRDLRKVLYGENITESARSEMIKTASKLLKTLTPDGVPVVKDSVDKAKMFYLLITRYNNKELVMPELSKLPKFKNIIRRVVLGKINFRNVPRNLAPGAIQLILLRLQQMVQQGEMNTEQASRIIFLLGNHYRKSNFIDQKKSILEGFGKLAANKSISPALRAISLIYIESAQTGDDISTRGIATEIFAEIKGYSLMKSLTGKIETNLAQVIESMGAKPYLADDILLDVDKVPFDFALETFKAIRTKCTCFELESAPTLSQLRMLSDLDFETHLLHDKLTGKYYIINGEQSTIRTVITSIFAQTGRVDISIHNHPSFVPEQEAIRPSASDMVSARLSVHNFIITKTGIVRFGSPKIKPSTGKNHVYQTTKELEMERDKWIAKIGAENATWDNYNRTFGMDMEISAWKDIAESQTVDQFAASFATQMPDTEILALGISRFNQMMYMFDKIQNLNQIVSSGDEIRSQSASDVILRFNSLFNEFQSVVKFKATAISAWLKDESGFIKGQLSISDPSAATNILRKLTQIEQLLDSIKTKDVRDLQNARVQISDILSVLSETHRIMFDITRDLNQLMAQLQSIDPKQYRLVSDFRIHMKKAIAEINNMRKILEYSGIKPSLEIITQEDDLFAKPDRLSLDSILGSANIDLTQIVKDLRDIKTDKTQYPQISVVTRKISAIDTELPFNIKVMQIGAALVDTGVADLIRKGKADLFELVSQPNFLPREQRIFTDLRNTQTEKEFIDVIKKHRMTFNEVKEIKRLFEFTPGGIPKGISSGVMRFQAYIRPDIKVGKQKVAGKLSKNGFTDLDNIKKEIAKDSSTVVVSVAGKNINIAVENEILKRLGFTSENRVAEFSEFLRSALVIRGETLFSGLTGGETIHLGIADTSDTLFVDHNDNAFIGINKVFFDSIDQKFIRPAFLVGVTHELRHEAGVYFDGKLIDQPDEVEEILTQEDTSLSRILIPELEQYVMSLEKIVQVREDASADYVAQLKNNSVDEYEPAVSDMEVAEEIEKAKQEVGGGQFFVVYEKGAATGKIGKSIEQAISGIKAKSAQYPVLTDVADFLRNSLTISAVPSADGSIGLYRKENLIRLAQPGIDIHNGKIDTLYLGKGIVEELSQKGAGLSEFLVFEGVKAFILQKLFDFQSVSIERFSNDLKMAGLTGFTSQLENQAKLYNITKVSDVIDLMYGRGNIAANELFKLELMNGIIQDALRFQKIMQTGDINFQSIKSQLMKDKKPQAVTYVLEHLGKADPSKNFLYVQFKNMERDHQQAIIEMITAKLGKNFEDNILDIAQRSDEIAVSIPVTVRDNIESIVGSNLPAVFIIPREFFELTVSQRNWNMEFFMNQFKENQKNTGKFVVFVAADADPQNPFSLMVNMKIKGVEGTDVDYVQRSENARQMMDSIKTRFPNSAIKVVDLPGGKISAEIANYSKFNKINLEVIPVEEEQFFYDALQGSVYISGIKTDIGLPAGETDLTSIVSDFRKSVAEKFSIAVDGALRDNDILTARHDMAVRLISDFMKSSLDRIDGADIKFIGPRLLDLQNNLQPDEFVKQVGELKRQAVFDALLKQYQLLKLQRLYSFFNLSDIEEMLSVYKQIVTEYGKVLAENGKVTQQIFHPVLDRIVFDAGLKNRIKKLNLGKPFAGDLKNLFESYIGDYINARYDGAYKDMLTGYVQKRFESFNNTMNLANTDGYLTTDAMNTFFDSAEGVAINPADASYLRQFGDDLFNKAKIIRSASENIMERIEKARALEQSA